MRIITVLLLAMLSAQSFANVCSTNAKEPQMIKVDQRSNGLSPQLHFEYCESEHGRCIQLGAREFYTIQELKMLENKLKRNGILKIVGHAGMILGTIASGYFLIDQPVPTIIFGVISCAGTFLTVTGIGDIKKSSVLSKIDQDKKVGNIQKFAHDLDTILRSLN